MDLLALYKAILKSLNLHVNKEDMIYMDYDNGKEPIMVKDKRLVLPTRDILREGLGDKRVAFHPVSENWLTEGETAVFVEFRKHATLALTTKALVLLVRLAQIAADTKSHNKLSPAQHEFLSHVPNMDQKAYNAIVSVLSHADVEGNDKLISLYVRKTGQLNGKSYNRLGIVRFPILDQLEEGSDTVFKVKLPRKKDVQTLRSLIEYVFPEAENTGTYSVGSNDDTAPGFDALVRAFINVAKRINSVVKLFRKVLEDGDVIKDWEELLIDVSWEDAMSDLSAYRGQIPNLDAAEKTGMVEQPTTHARTIQPTTTTAMPVADAAALRGDEGSTGGFNIDMYRNQTRPTLVAPTIAAPGQPVNYGVIPKVESADGVDFNALRAKNAATVTGMAPQQVYLQPGQPAINPGNVAPPGYVQTPNGLVPAHLVDPRMIDPRMAAGMVDPRVMGQPVWMDPNAGAGVMGSFPGVGGGMAATTLPAARLSTTEQQMMLGRTGYGVMPAAVPPGYVQTPDGRLVPANMVDPRYVDPRYMDPRMAGGMAVNAAGIPVTVDPRYYVGGTVVNTGVRDPYAGLGINR